MTTVDQIRADRERREEEARRIAATLPPGLYYADSADVRCVETREIVHNAASHWDACLIMLAAAAARRRTRRRNGHKPDETP